MVDALKAPGRRTCPRPRRRGRPAPPGPRPRPVDAESTPSPCGGRWAPTAPTPASRRPSTSTAAPCPAPAACACRAARPSSSPWRSGPRLAGPLARGCRSSASPPSPSATLAPGRAYATLADAARREVLDATLTLYDHAFVLLAWAWAQKRRRGRARGRRPGPGGRGDRPPRQPARRLARGVGGSALAVQPAHAPVRGFPGLDAGRRLPPLEAAGAGRSRAGPRPLHRRPKRRPSGVLPPGLVPCRRRRRPRGRTRPPVRMELAARPLGRSRRPR